MADAAVQEARVRIRCALRASDFEIPRCALTVSLAPGDVRKTGSGFDLPIAVAILALTNQIPVSGLDDYLFAGELGLDGSVNAVSGEVAYQLRAGQRPFLRRRTGRHACPGSGRGLWHLVSYRPFETRYRCGAWYACFD
ncbi:MAG: magnesium chelatase domain-containing protein [Collinsella intestinalis]